jgi:adenylate cyclase
MGRSELAIERAKLALRLSPFDPSLWVSYLGLGLAYFKTGMLDDSLEATRRAIRANPRFSTSHTMLAAILARLGRPSEAKAAATQVMAMEPSFSTGAFVAFFFRDEAFGQEFATASIAAGLPP